MKKSDKPIYNYNYLKGEEAYIKCAECGAECLCHDGEYECSVCGNTGWTGEPMPEIDDQKWFEIQCLEQGICAEDIFVVGDYATNKEGDFLYSVENEAGEDVMKYVRACDLIDSESTYAEWLLLLMKNREAGFLQGDEMQAWHRRTKTPWEMSQVFRECVCRNEMLTRKGREQLRKIPVYGVLEPAMEVDSRKGQYLGLCDETSDNASLVILPEEVEDAKGYRFALKIVDLDAFLEQYACLRNEGQHGSFQILADLEKCVARAWQEKHEVSSRYAIYMYDDPTPEDEVELYHNSALFRFSHFEIEDELDEEYRTIYACYKEEYDL